MVSLFFSIFYDISNELRSTDFRDTNLTPKCSHSLQQFRCVLLLRTENVNVCVVCCRNIRMAKPLADYADRYARFQCPRSKGMSQLM